MKEFKSERVESRLFVKLVANNQDFKRQWLLSLSYLSFSTPLALKISFCIVNCEPSLSKIFNHYLEWQNIYFALITSALVIISFRSLSDCTDFIFSSESEKLLIQLQYFEKSMDTSMEKILFEYHSSRIIICEYQLGIGDERSVWHGCIIGLETSSILWRVAMRYRRRVTFLH